MKTKSYTFEAVIQQAGNINAAFVAFPFDAQQLFGTKGQVKVMAVIDGTAEYRGSLAKMNSEGHLLGLTQDIRKKTGKTFGDKVFITLWQDKEERVVELPADVKEVFKNETAAKTIFDAMSYTHRKEYIRWVTEAKKPETRERRKQKMIEMILAGKKGI